jgi:uncharacterized protein (DUF342 family)
MSETTATTPPPTADLAATSDGAPGAPVFDLRLSGDKVRVLLDCPDPLQDLAGTVARISEELEALGLPEYPDEAFISQALQNICRPGQHLRGVTLVMGQAPVPPQHGQLKWSRDYFVEGWEIAADESIDFWARLDQRSVTAEEKLLVMRPAVAGEPGLNVFGNKIPVDKPQKVRVRCGKGVREIVLDDGLTTFYAEIAGRVRFADNTLSVDDIYLVKGNVNLETGNIHHTGSLQIDGDVETGASIEADGDISIKGMLEPANVRAGGSLTVHGGIVGSPETMISVGGQLHAKYIKEALIRAEGHVTVANEITYCDIETRGKVEASRGRIAGGRTIARMGITVGEAGASGSSQTLLAAGVDPTLDAKVNALKKKIHYLEDARVKLSRTIQIKRDEPDARAESQQTLINGLTRKSANLGQAILDAERDIERLVAEARAGACEAIYMLRECWAGSTVQLGHDKTLVRKSVLKPRLAKRINGRVRVVPLGENNLPDPHKN